MTIGLKFEVVLDQEFSAPASLLWNIENVMQFTAFNLADVFVPEFCPAPAPRDLISSATVGQRSNKGEKHVRSWH